MEKGSNPPLTIRETNREGPSRGAPPSPHRLRLSPCHGVGAASGPDAVPMPSPAAEAPLAKWRAVGVLNVTCVSSASRRGQGLCFTHGSLDLAGPQPCWSGPPERRALPSSAMRGRSLEGGKWAALTWLLAHTRLCGLRRPLSSLPGRTVLWDASPSPPWLRLRLSLPGRCSVAFKCPPPRPRAAAPRRGGARTVPLSLLWEVKGLTHRKHEGRRPARLR